MIVSIILGLVGAVCTVFGYLIGVKEKISLLHEYHYDKVSEEDKKNFCRLSGLGVVFVGVGILLTAVMIGFTNSLWSFAPFVVCFIIGIILLICAGTKYNR